MAEQLAEPAESTPAVPELIVKTVQRFQCPHCSRAWSKRSTAAQHMPRCWKGPDYHGCRTCDLFTAEERISVEPLGVVSVIPATCDAGENIGEHRRGGRCPSWATRACENCGCDRFDHGGATDSCFTPDCSCAGFSLRVEAAAGGS